MNFQMFKLVLPKLKITVLTKTSRTSNESNLTNFYSPQHSLCSSHTCLSEGLHPHQAAMDSETLQLLFLLPDLKNPLFSSHREWLRIRMFLPKKRVEMHFLENLNILKI